MGLQVVEPRPSEVALEPLDDGAVALGGAGPHRDGDVVAHPAVEVVREGDAGRLDVCAVVDVADDLGESALGVALGAPDGEPLLSAPAGAGVVADVDDEGPGAVAALVQVASSHVM